MLSELKHQFFFFTTVTISLILIGIQQFTAGYILSAVVLLVADCLILICLYIWFIKAVTDPIEALTGFAERIAEGGYGTVMKVTGEDEIAKLGMEINNMSQQVAVSEKTRTDFVSQISHELRTPLTAITGWAETIAFDPALEGDSKRGIEIITKEAERLTGMVYDLLEFTRIQDGRFTLNVEDIDIGAELEDALFTYAELFRQQGIVVNYGVANDDIPLIPGDPERLKQVFINPFNNAAKHGGDGKKIDVSLGRDEVSVIIVIRDYGHGIPVDELPHIKERFYKGSSKREGSGIGLAVCDEIIARHNGWLEIGNANGGGCIVTIRLPLSAI